MNKKINIGLFGKNGHQIHNCLGTSLLGEIKGIADFPEDMLPEGIDRSAVKKYSSLDEMLADPGIQLVSLCSSLRSEQASHAVKCMEAKKHVYAEKPSALVEEDLDRIIETSSRTGMIYHEMASTAFSQPYSSVRKIIQDGRIGDIIQIFSQKSYPWMETRPQNEDIDGGLALQVGVYNTRFVEHVAGVKIKNIRMIETKKGNTLASGECRRAASFIMELENGGISSALCNYCCPMTPTWNKWGYEILRVFGTAGFVESVNHGELCRIAVNGKPCENFDTSEKDEDYLEMFLREISQGVKIIPFTTAEELSPTRWVVRAKKQFQK